LHSSKLDIFKEFVLRNTAQQGVELVEERDRDCEKVGVFEGVTRVGGRPVS